MKLRWFAVLGLALAAAPDARSETIFLDAGGSASDQFGAYLFTYADTQNALIVVGNSFSIEEDINGDIDDHVFQNNLAGFLSGEGNGLAFFRPGSTVDAYVQTSTYPSTLSRADLFVGRVDGTNTEYDAVDDGALSLDQIDGSPLAIAGHFFHNGMTQINPPSLDGNGGVLTPMIFALLSMEGDQLRLDLSYDFESVAQADADYPNNPIGTRIVVGAEVPEPATLGLAALGALAFLRRSGRGSARAA